MTEDCDVYVKYPHHHKWFNKLWIAEQMGYVCGPGGVDIPEEGTYVIRPIYNLGGMGAGASVKKLTKGDYSTCPPGYFWCEYLTGKHYSANYRWKPDHITGGRWEGVSCWEGINMPLNVTKFVEWNRSDYIPDIDIRKHPEFKSLSDVKEINVEWKGGDIIEVHLRSSPDPDYDTLIPVWASDLGPKKQHYELHGFDFIESYDNSNGYIDDPRIGFFVK